MRHLQESTASSFKYVKYADRLPTRLRERSLMISPPDNFISQPKK